MKIYTQAKAICATVFALALIPSTLVEAHHSFSMYNMKRTQVFTGVVTGLDPAPNHLQIVFAPMNPERKNVERDTDGEPVLWTIEMQGSARMAREGVSVNSFPAGTVISVALHPLRNGDNAGFRVGGLFRCPDRTPPAAGMHCDTVEGHIAIGGEALVAETVAAE